MARVDICETSFLDAHDHITRVFATFHVAVKTEGLNCNGKGNFAPRRSETRFPGLSRYKKIIDGKLLSNGYLA